jgi:hypothetical protein
MILLSLDGRLKIGESRYHRSRDVNQYPTRRYITLFSSIGARHIRSSHIPFPSFLFKMSFYPIMLQSERLGCPDIVDNCPAAE